MLEAVDGRRIDSWQWPPWAELARDVTLLLPDGHHYPVGHLGRGHLQVPEPVGGAGAAGVTE